jgi:hypothetical protein
LWLQVRVPLAAFPITYKYGLQRKGSHMELEVRAPLPGTAKFACHLLAWGW